MSGGEALSDSESSRLAQELLDNPVFAMILSELETDAIGVWRRSASAQQREDQWHMVTAIAVLASRIKTRAEAIKIAAHNRRSAARSQQ